MTSSAEGARLVLAKWYEEDSPLKVVYAGALLGFTLAGTLSNLSKTAFVVEIVGPGGTCLLDLRDADFTYDDSRTAPAPVREAAVADFIDVLQFRLSDGDRVAIFQRRPGAPTAAE